MDLKLLEDNQSSALSAVLEHRLNDNRFSDRAREIMTATRSESTNKTYQIEWKRFLRWSEEVGIDEYPVSAHTLGAYLVWMHDKKYSKSTISKSLTVISLVHDERDDPTGDKVIRQMIKGICRLDRRVPKKAPALGLNELIAMCTRLKQRGTDKDLRNRAMLSLGWMGAMRASEVVALHWSDIEHVSQGFEITIRESKTNQGKGPELIALPFLSVDYEMVCPVRNILALITPIERRCVGIYKKPVFSRSGTSGNSLSPRTIDRVLKSAAAMAGINRPYTSHSLRRGWATFAADRGIGERELMKHGRWKTSQVAQGYVERSDIWRHNPIANLLG